MGINGSKQNALIANKRFGKNWLTERSINFYLATQQQLSAGHYKFGSIDNNGLLIIKRGKLTQLKCRFSTSLASHTCT